MCHSRNPLHCIVPPYLLDHLARSEDQRVRDFALRNLQASASLRTMRVVMPAPSILSMNAFGSLGRKSRRVYDLRHAPPTPAKLPGILARSEGQPATGNPAVDEAYDGAGETYDFYDALFGRDSIDGRGMAITSTVHAGDRFDNAFWNGRQMVYGDGDGIVFDRFTRALDVIGHELTHGVVGFECDLEYHDQSGALNEHFADVFGSLVRQRKLGQSAATADWLIGADIVIPDPVRESRRALRSMAQPGTAFVDDEFLGTDPQPRHMRNYNPTAADDGGVHINSGIPNHAFFLAASAIGGNAWDHAGRIWYEAMRTLTATSNFDDMAATTRRIAANYRANALAASAVDNAWTSVGL